MKVSAENVTAYFKWAKEQGAEGMAHQAARTDEFGQLLFAMSTMSKNIQTQKLVAAGFEDTDDYDGSLMADYHKASLTPVGQQLLNSRATPEECAAYLNGWLCAEHQALFVAEFAA